MSQLHQAGELGRRLTVLQRDVHWEDWRHLCAAGTQGMVTILEDKKAMSDLSVEWRTSKFQAEGLQKMLRSLCQLPTRGSTSRPCSRSAMDGQGVLAMTWSWETKRVEFHAAGKGRKGGRGGGRTNHGGAWAVSHLTVTVSLPLLGASTSSIHNLQP